MHTRKVSAAERRHRCRQRERKARAERESQALRELWQQILSGLAWSG